MQRALRASRQRGRFWSRPSNNLPWKFEDVEQYDYVPWRTRSSSATSRRSPTLMSDPKYPAILPHPDPQPGDVRRGLRRARPRGLGPVRVRRAVAALQGHLQEPGSPRSSCRRPRHRGDACHDLDGHRGDDRRSHLLVVRRAVDDRRARRRRRPHDPPVPEGGEGQSRGEPRTPGNGRSTSRSSRSLRFVIVTARLVELVVRPCVCGRRDEAGVTHHGHRVRAATDRCLHPRLQLGDRRR